MCHEVVEQLKEVLAHEIGVKPQEITNRHIEALIKNLKDMLAGDDFCDQFEARDENNTYQLSGMCQGCGHYLCKECVHLEEEEEDLEPECLAVCEQDPITIEEV